MKIAFVSSEISPFASTGGLGEVAGGLPAELARQGAEIVRFMPMYRRVLEGPWPCTFTGIRLQIPVGMRTYTAEVFTADTPEPRTYFIRRDEFFDRGQLYNLPDRDYDDNFERYVFFQKAVVALMDHIGFKADVVHGNDWQAGLLPLFLGHGIQGRTRAQREPFVFTIHNLAYQGVYPVSDYALTNLPFQCFSVDTLEYYGKMNCMKCGVTGAAAVTTVSPSYAREVQTDEGGFGLHGVLRSAQTRLTGILNGIDTVSWNPEADPNLPARYSAQDMVGKGICRSAFMRQEDLDDAVPGTVLFCMVTRMVEQKGLDILADIMPELMKRKAALFILGSGSPRFEEMFRSWAAKFPGRVALQLGYDAAMAHRVVAASDAMLVPSRYEPCGLSQFYAMRYGTLPVVHNVGGLADAVEDIDPDGTKGCGITFQGMTPLHLLAAVDRVVSLHADAAKWKAAQRRAMVRDFSWTAPAKAYLDIYQRVLKR